MQKIIIFFLLLGNIFCVSIACVYAQKIVQDIPYLEEMHAKNPQSLEVALELAKQYKAKKEFHRALDILLKTKTAYPENTDILFEIGLLSSWLGNYGDAIQYFKNILALIPHHYDAKIALARVFSWQDKRKEALELCDQVLKDVPEYIDAYELKGRIHTWNSNFPEAIRMYEEILQRDPQNNQAKIGLVNVRAAEGNYSDAVSQYKKMIAENPRNSLAYRELGKVLSWKSEYDEAIKYLQKALELEPSDDQAKEALARVYRWSGRYDEGIAKQKEFLNHHPDDINAMMEISLLYEMQGNSADALFWNAKASQLDPHNPQINARLGMLYFRAERIDDAINALQRSLKVRDNDVESLILLGRVYSWKERIQESAQLYQEAIRLDPTNEEAHIGLGRTYFYNDEWLKAKREFRNALDINPLNKEAEKELMKLNNLSKPSGITRYDYSAFRNYDPEQKVYDEAARHAEISQSVEWAPSAFVSGAVQYRRINEDEVDGEGITHYQLTGDEYSIELHAKAVKNLSITGTLTAGSYAAEHDDIYTMDEDKNLLTGFCYAQYDYGRWLFSAVYSKEPLYPVISGAAFVVGDLKDAGGSVRYDVTRQMRIYSSYINRMYFDKRHRKEYTGGMAYILPFFRPCTIHYRYQQRTDASDTHHTYSADYKNKWRRIQYELSYNFETSSLLGTETHAAKTFWYVDIMEALKLNVDTTAEMLRRNDKDKNYYTKVYVTYHF